MVDFNLSDEQRMYQNTAREFALREIKPVAEAIRQRDPEKQSPWDLMQSVYKKASALGFTKLLIPEQYGGLGGSCLDNVIVMEEFGAADLGIAASYFNVSMTSPIVIIKGGNEAQRQHWLTRLVEEDDFVLASASSEANVAGADSFCPYPDPKIGLRSTAKLDGDSYIINGSKAGFSTNAGAAKAYFVMARTDLNQPAFASTSMFIVDANTPGVTVGKKTKLMGWKTAMHAEVYFDDVRIPVANRIGAEGANAGIFFMQTIPYLASGLAAAYVGMARAAYEYAFEYAHQRVSWGQPIVNHQAVALKLADMVADVEAARLMVWRLACAADANDPYAAGVLSPAAKTFAVDVAIRNAERALKILGGYGLADEYETGKFLNDAWIGDACDGTRDMLRLSMVNFLRMQAGKMPMPSMGGEQAPGH
ncbi:MAG: acyl-CoA dehydrogenase family protein [Gammaproteobacteria bacterium]|nr:acyl-CoA dehydrogenase family protein [Gammaproteobacteria bacterium]